MNAYLGDRGGPFTGGYIQFKKTASLVRPGPTRTWIFIDEREDSINDGWFAVDMAGYDPRNPGSWRTVDVPASYHGGAGQLSFADGHSEIRPWKDARTKPPLAKNGSIALGVPSPNNQDVEWLQERSTAKVSKPTRN